MVELKRTPWNSVLLCGETKSVLLNQRQDSRSFQFLVEEEASALRPSRVELYLHLPVRFEVVRREALHIALVEVRNVEYPLSAHLVLDVEFEQQLVEADGTIAVVLGRWSGHPRRDHVQPQLHRRCYRGRSAEELLQV